MKYLGTKLSQRWNIKLYQTIYISQIWDSFIIYTEINFFYILSPI